MAKAFYSYIPFGQSATLNQECPVKETQAPHSTSRTGYGNRLPTSYMIRKNNRWLRVYAVCYSNCATLYVGPVKNKTIVRIDNF